MNDGILTMFLNGWFALSLLHRLGFLLLASIALLYFPCADWVDARQQRFLLRQEMQRKQAELHHQEKLNTVMKQHSQESVLSPELAGQLSPINQRIRELSARLAVTQSQWQFQQKPSLEMHVSGRFQDIRRFVTTLLRQFPNLSLLELNLHKPEERQKGEPVDGMLRFQVVMNKEGA